MYCIYFTLYILIYLLLSNAIIDNQCMSSPWLFHSDKNNVVWVKNHMFGYIVHYLVDKLHQRRRTKRWTIQCFNEDWSFLFPVVDNKWYSWCILRNFLSCVKEFNNRKFQCQPNPMIMLMITVIQKLSINYVSIFTKRNVFLKLN